MKLGTMDDIRKDMEAGVFDYTNDGVCSNCGECCSDFLPVTVKEIQTIRKYIKRNRIREQVHFLPTAKAAIDMICPFRNNNEKRCEIYEVRPMICRDFQCDKPKKGVRADASLFTDEHRIISMKETFYPKKKKGEHQ